MKQQGALLAKGRITGLQFETLMEENRYVEYGAKAVRLATSWATTEEDVDALLALM